MTEHQFFILGSYGMAAIALAVEIIWLRTRTSRTLQSLRESREMGEQ
jgi:heme exporter protein CcmD